MQMVFGLVLHVTVLSIVGYALLYTAAKAEGLVALIGRLLGLWVFLLAILSVVGAVAIHMGGGKLFGMDMRHVHDGPGMHQWGPPDGPPPPPPPEGGNQTPPPGANQAPAPAATPAKP